MALREDPETAIGDRGPRLSRRRLLKSGVVAAAVLVGAGGMAAWLLRGRQRAPAPGLGFLTGSDQALFEAIAGVVLEDALPPDVAIADVVVGIDRSIRGLPPATQAELRQLFDLLALAPARLLLVGLWDDWASASPAAVRAALDDLQGSSFALKRSIYAALHELPAAAWYADPRSWPAIGYDGPPDVARPARLR